MLYLYEPYETLLAFVISTSGAVAIKVGMLKRTVFLYKAVLGKTGVSRIVIWSNINYKL